MVQRSRDSSIEQAIDYIELHIDDDLTPSAVASAIGFSEYHFHRLFSAALGESISEYIRKRRLVRAARRLEVTGDSIMEIALSCRFDSQEAFTRAFKRAFGVTPGKFRSTGPHGFVFKPRTTEAMIAHLCKGVTMIPEIVERDAELAIGMGAGFEPKSVGAIGKLWGEFVDRMPEIQHAKEGYTLGICCNQQAGIEKSAGQIIYIAAMPVASSEAVPDGMVCCLLPGGRYAKFTHKGPVSDLPHTVDYIWGTWLPKGEYEFRDAPDFELYDDRFCPQTMDGEIDIYVPVK